MTLIKAVASTLPQYCMSVFLLPKGWCVDIDKILKEFWWGSPAHKSHNFTPRAWNLICLPKDQGGLGIRKSFEVNQALIAKLAWSILTQPNKVWVQLLQSKYLRRSHFLGVDKTPNSSWVWKGILQVRDIIQEG